MEGHGPSLKRTVGSADRARRCEMPQARRQKPRDGRKPARGETAEARQAPTRVTERPFAGRHFPSGKQENEWCLGSCGPL